MNVIDEDVVPSPKTAAEYRAAIAALDESTRAIEAHLDASRKVLEASKRQLQSHSQTASGRTEPHSHRKQISRLIDSLRVDVSNTHAESSADLQKFVAAVLIATDDTLARHDHGLELLEQEQPGDLESSAKKRNEDTETLIGALQHCIAETIRIRLERIYLEALHHNANDLQNGSHRPVEAKSNLVQEDLRILHSEVDDVAQMLVMQQYGSDLNLTNQKLRESELRWNDSRAQRASHQMDSMNDQLDALIERTELLQSHRELQKRIGTFLEDSQNADSRQPSPVKTESRSSPRRNASLIALRQCLGIDSPTYNDKSRGDRIDSMFTEFMEHLNSGLSLQSDHLDIFQQGVTLQFTEKRVLPNASVLDEVDVLISTIKSKIDKT